MIKKSKKAETTFGMLLFGVMAVATLIVVIVIASKTMFKTAMIAEDSECKSSIFAHTTLLDVTGEAKVTDIYCPTRYYTMPAKNEEQVKQALADSLKSCYGTWGQGELHLFDGDGLFCHICSVVEFKNKDVKVNNFLEYLSNTKINDDAYQPTYAVYLNMYENGYDDPQRIEQVIKNTKPVEIDSSKKYATIFVYAKGTNSIKNFLESISSTGASAEGGAIVGGTAGALVGGIGMFGAGKALVAVGAMSGPFGWVTTGTVVLGTAVVFGFAGFYDGLIIGKDVEYVAMPLLVEYNAENLNKIGCTISPVKQSK